MSVPPGNLNALLRWSLSFQADEDAPRQTDESTTTQQPQRHITPEDASFFMDAIDSHTMDEQKRTKILLQVLRLPENPTLLYYIREVSFQHKIHQLEEQYTLHSVLDMRKDDQRRKLHGLDTIAKEYIPTTRISLLDTFRITKRLEFEHLATIQDQQEDQAAAAQPATAQPATSTTTTSTTTTKTSPKGHVHHYIAPSDDELYETLQALIPTIPAPNTEQLDEISTLVRQAKLAAFDELDERILNVNNSVGIVKCNGLPILRHYMQSSDFELAAWAFRITASVISNQQFCQTQALQAGLLPIAIEVISLPRYLPFILPETYFQNVQPAVAATADDNNNDKNKNDTQNLITSHYGRSYSNHIVQLIRAALYFIQVLCTNHSAAQTQLIQWHGLIPLGYLLEFGAIYLCQNILTISNIRQDTTNDSQSSHTSITSSDDSIALLQSFQKNLLPAQFQAFVQPSQQQDSSVQIAQPLESLLNIAHTSQRPFIQLIRRVMHIITALIDPEFGVTTSQTLLQRLYQLFHQYRSLLSSTSTSTSSQHNLPSINAGDSLLTLLNSPQECLVSAQALHLGFNQSNVILPPRHRKQDVAAAAATPETQQSITENDTTPNQQTPELLSQQQEQQPQQFNDQKDEGFSVDHFNAPDLPLMVENGEIHPAFEVKSNRQGGILDKEGKHIEEQIAMNNIMALFIIQVAFPVQLWPVYLAMVIIDPSLSIATTQFITLLQTNNTTSIAAVDVLQDQVQVPAESTVIDTSLYIPVCNIVQDQLQSFKLVEQPIEQQQQEQQNLPALISLLAERSQLFFQDIIQYQHWDESDETVVEQRDEVNYAFEDFAAVGQKQ